jgi:mycothiol synthase
LSHPQSRAFSGQADFDAAIALHEAIQVADDGPAVYPEDLTAEWINDEPGWIRTLRVWTDHERIVASFGVWQEVADSEDRAYGQIDVYPDYRSDPFMDEVTGALVEACKALTGKSVTLRVAGLASSPEWRAALERSGFAAERVWHRMRTRFFEPEPVAPMAGGFTIRPLVGKAEAAKWAETFTCGFAEHFDAHSRSTEDKLYSMGLASYRPELDLVLIDSEGAIAGICQCNLEPTATNGDQAWVNHLAVLPKWRGLGLGRALLTAGLNVFHKLGYREVWLTVDSENESGALGLYESAGFEPVYRLVMYRRLVAPDQT